MTKVTAIVSAYYAEEFLQGRIENLLEQGYPDLEILVSCQDQSAEAKIMGSFTYPAVRVILTADIPGLYATWNHLVGEATGKYLTNANCDDRLYPGAIERLATALDESPNVGVVYAFDDIVKELGGDPVNRHLWIEGQFFELVHGCFVGPMPMWRKSLHTEFGMFDDQMDVAGDYEFWLRVTSKGTLLKRIPLSVGAFLERPSSISNKQALRTLWESARARSRYVDWRSLYDEVDARGNGRRGPGTLQEGKEEELQNSPLSSPPPTN
jgi:glycosyltransferase involved in cell wall biosynthesis